MVFTVVRWAVFLGLIAGLIYLLQRLLFFFYSLYNKSRKKTQRRHHKAFSTTNPLDKHKSLNLTPVDLKGVESFLAQPDKAAEFLESQGITLSLLLAARAAERGMLPFYSLCGAMFIDAIPQRLYHLNQDYQAVLLSDIINIPDSSSLTHVFAVYKGDDEPILTIAAEMNPSQDELNELSNNMGMNALKEELSWGQQLWKNEGFSHFLSVFSDDKQSNLGSSDRWSHLETFEKRALRLALDKLGIDTAPHVMDDGSSTKFLEMTAFDDELQKDLTYCLELHGMFMMVRIALQEELSEDELEHASLHRFRIDVYLKALASQTRIPIDIGMMMLADLKIFSEHVQEHLEGNSLSYIDVIGPIYQEDTLFVPLDQLSWDERTQRQKRIFNNPELISTIQHLMSEIETSADVKFEEQTKRNIPTFDV